MIDRTEIAPGIIASATLVGEPGARIFVCRTGPIASTAISRLVVCPPVGGEAARNYRREVLLSRRLAVHGIETIRFQYRGTGHSDASPDDGFTAMLEDAETVRQQLGDDLPVAWMGTRLGGAVAATVAAGLPGAPLIIWDPVLDSSAYFREILRARVFSAFKTDETGTAPKADLIGDLRACGSVDLLGYSISARLLDELNTRPSIKHLPVNGRPVLMVDLRRKGDPRNEVVRLGNDWQSAGGFVQVSGIALYEPWWYGARSGAVGDERTNANVTLLELTADYVAGLDMVRR